MCTTCLPIAHTDQKSCDTLEEEWQVVSSQPVGSNNQTQESSLRTSALNH